MRHFIVSLVFLAAITLGVTATHARGGGGCVAEGTLIDVPAAGGAARVPVEALRPGDKVAAQLNGKMCVGRVIASQRVEPHEFVELTTHQGTLRLTPEHPVAVAPGVFRVAGDLRVGDALLRQRLLHVGVVTARRAAYHLIVSPGGTFTANGVLVHNKGCFLPDTPVLLPDGQWRAISTLRVGDRVMAFNAHGRPLTTTVREVFSLEAPDYLEVTTDRHVVHVTREHPFFVGHGEFRTLESLRVGDRIYAWDGQALTPQPIVAIRAMDRPATVYNLRTDDPHTFVASGIAVHNKGGGCFPAGTRISTPNGPVAIERLTPGDVVIALDRHGRRTTTILRQTHSTTSPLVIIHTEQGTLRTTREHPLLRGDGAFVDAGTIGAGDALVQMPDHMPRGAASAPMATRVLSVAANATPAPVYNLTVDAPHTFIADGFVVHNKGGGCFPAGALIDTSRGQRPIESLTPGDSVTAVGGNGARTAVRIHALHAVRAPLVRVRTAVGDVNVTADHPVALGNGSFIAAGDLLPGDRVVACRGGTLQSIEVHGVEPTGDARTVFNLSVAAPHTFIADGFVVHNKGGGFGGGGGFRGGGGGYHGFRSYGGRTSSTTQPGPGGIFGCASPALLLAVFIAAALIFKGIYARARGGNSLFSNRGSGSLFAGRSDDAELDELPDTLALGRKASQTRALIQRLAPVDPIMNVERMQAAARETFIELQRCWGARNYGPMRSRMMPDLLADHLRQIEAMKRQHEINLVADLGVERVEIVNVRFTTAVNQREFTAMILAHARDYYIDDRTQAFIRGDRQPARFAEYWTFQQWDGRWLLREIEQITESRVLNEANFVDSTAAPGVSEAEGHGAATVITTGGRIAEMMGSLAARDPSWARELISARVRRAYTSVYMARQAGDPGQIAGDLIAPDLAQALRQEIENRQRAGETIEHRNFCIRKVEVVAISGTGIRWGKRFVARVVAHGQTIIRRGETIREQDADLRRWTEYASFEKVSDRWLLTALTPGLPASEE